jgi:hypothetical protein
MARHGARRAQHLEKQPYELKPDAMNRIDPDFRIRVTGIAQERKVN